MTPDVESKVTAAVTRALRELIAASAGQIAARCGLPLDRVLAVLKGLERDGGVHQNGDLWVRGPKLGR